MQCRYRTPLVKVWYVLVLLVGYFCVACEREATPPPHAVPAGQERHFTGTWTATGDRVTMQLGPVHVSAIFRYSGSLLLSGEQRVNAGFKGDIIGFADSRSGMQGRCTWTDERGDKVFSELHSETIGTGQPIAGRFIGGTGRYAGATGEYSFKWQRLTETGDGKVSGRVVDLKGWIRLDIPAADQANPGGRQ